LEDCLNDFAKGGADVVFTVTDARRNPYFSMVKRHPDGTIGLVIPPEGSVFRRQDAPVVYDITPVAYVARPEYVMTRVGLFEGNARIVHIPPERAVDIDTLLDFKFAECLLSQSPIGTNRLPN
jgi:N-acylneuraminate cytidylyltransferase